MDFILVTTPPPPHPPKKKPNKNEIPVLSTTFYKANDFKVNGSNVL